MYWALIETTPGGELLPPQTIIRGVAPTQVLAEAAKLGALLDQSNRWDWFNDRNLLPDWFEYRDINSRFSVVQVPTLIA